MKALNRRPIIVTGYLEKIERHKTTLIVCEIRKILEILG